MARTRRTKNTKSTASPPRSTLSAPNLPHPANNYEEPNAFTSPPDTEKDHLSTLPTEILHEILSYVVLDHDPEYAVKVHSHDPHLEPNPHVLLSLAAMSRHFRSQIEDFARRHLVKFADEYALETAEAKAQRLGSRRSERLKTKKMLDSTVYRMELVRELERWCFRCDKKTERRAVMMSGVACCRGCEEREFGKTINLTTAMKKYDLRDWMLIATRKPGPRAKVTDLPVITYGTIRTGTPYHSGMTMSYKFYENDVKMVAEAVHGGNLERHMRQKQAARHRRKLEKRQITHRLLKVRYHQDKLDYVTREHRVEYHEERLAYYQDPNCPEPFELGNRRYGKYGDIHRRLCIREDCSRRHDYNKRKYCEWWRETPHDYGRNEDEEHSEDEFYEDGYQSPFEDFI